MRIKVIRKIFTDDFTVGELYIDDCFICETLEDKVRDLKTIEDKVPGKTAIPYGIYRVILSWSNRFKKVLPEILGVLFFSGVRIHSGNRAADSRGCILVGKYYKDGVLIKSRECMSLIMNKLIECTHEKKEEITIEITSE